MIWQSQYFFATTRGNAISRISVLNSGSGILLFELIASIRGERMSATRIQWGQITIVLAVVFITVWGATQWTAWRLGFQPQLGRPWFELWSGIPVYVPPALFWWWYVYDAYAPRIFLEGGCIAASGGFLSIALSIGMSVWRAREQKNVGRKTRKKLPQQKRRLRSQTSLRLPRRSRRSALPPRSRLQAGPTSPNLRHASRPPKRR
jgi:hypothetical protein